MIWDRVEWNRMSKKKKKSEGMSRLCKKVKKEKKSREECLNMTHNEEREKQILIRNR